MKLMSEETRILLENERKNTNNQRWIDHCVAVVFVFDLVCRYGTGAAMYCAD